MPGCTGVGGDDEQALAVRDIHHWRCARLSAPGTGGCEQKQGSVGKRAIGLVAVYAKILYQLAVVVLLIYHGLSGYHCQSGDIAPGGI
jgi:hypothetical protein